MAAQVVNFLILLFILKKFLYGPILKILENRKKTIEQSLKNAEEIELQLQKTKEQSEKIIADTLKEAQKILDQTKEVAAQMIADTNKDAEQILLQAQEDGKKIIELQKVQMMEQLKGNLSGIVELGLEKVWGRKINAEQKKVIEEVVKES